MSPFAAHFKKSAHEQGRNPGGKTKQNKTRKEKKYTTNDAAISGGGDAMC